MNGFRKHAGSSARARKVGVSFDRSGVALALKMRRRGGVSFRRSRVGAGGEEFPMRADAYREALAELVARENVAGARCAAALPAARCRVRWETLAGARLHELRDAVRHSAFWRTRLGVDLESHCVWWRFTPDAGGRGIGALLCAAPRKEVGVYVETVRGAGLRPDVVGVSCFDYFDGEFPSRASTAALILDCDDACVLATGAFGLRAHAVEFGESDAAALAEGGETRRAAAVDAVVDAVVDDLAVCVQRSVEDERAATRSRADVKVIAAPALCGNWLELLQARLPGFAVETVDGWKAAGVAAVDEEARGGPWRLPRAAARLVRARPAPGIVPRLARRGAGAAVNFTDARAAVRRRYSAVASVGAACALSAAAAYAHWSLLEEHRRLKPAAEEHARLAEFRVRARELIKTLQSGLSHRVLFYSAIQHVSFERKLMPRLLELIENAALEGVWLNEIHFKRPESLRITGKSLSDERIAGFIRRLRRADEIAEVLLESASVETGAAAASPPETRRLKDFVVACRLRTLGGNP